ncbi:MAG: tyrosine-type recombinase/integrase [Campylobacterota bacterium]|nr:tyrosine-type recombinase/integrase [Campylobacterota bacterium]
MEKIKKEVGLYRNKLASGDTTYYYMFKDVYGKAHQVKVGRHSQGYRINDARNQRLAAIAENQDKPEALLIKKMKKKNVITFQDLADRYYVDKKNMKSYQDSINKYNDKIKPVFGNINVLAINFGDIEQFQMDLMESYAPASVNYFTAIIKSIFNHAIERDVIDMTSPAKKIKQLKLDNKRERVLSARETICLLRSIERNKKAYLFMIISLSTGARPDAVLSLRKLDVDTRKKEITFKAMKKRPKYTNPIGKRLLPVIREWIKELEQDEYLFYRENPSLNKKVHIGYASILSRIQPKMDELFNVGLPPNDRINRVTLYTFRHTFATYLAYKGVDAFTLMKVMNHASLKMTERYVKPSIEKVRKVLG